MAKELKGKSIERLSEEPIGAKDRQEAYDAAVKILETWRDSQGGALMLIVTTPRGGDDKDERVLSSVITGQGAEVSSAIAGVASQNEFAYKIFKQGLHHVDCEKGGPTSGLMDFLSMLKGMKNESSPSQGPGDASETGALTPEEIEEVMKG